ncbi:Protein of unknown function [Octadecabacter temperatus]|uniref:Uncharacterized protein n=1 Tax=Octadecabacter temperatus TaxID=1458307 RepID=A0A0K0Y5I0_9RHOB|nr:DUF3592 domain-containing protein [Octadecabacter temperatus]AKS46209.1 hypothetical protein OSB_16610 [Octadecabacter temperatus]SIO09713.1 Protein of unknown function [Octadecabacter temperatus]
MPSWTPQLNFNRRFWVGCAITLLSFSFLVVTAVQSRDAYSLSREGIPAEATVTDTRSTAPTPDSPSKFFLTYTYSSNDQAITNERTVPEPFFETHPVGMVWTITVHPNDPTRHELFEGEKRQTAISALIFSALLALFGATLALSGGNLTALRHRLSS